MSLDPYDDKKPGNDAEDESGSGTTGQGGQGGKIAYRDFTTSTQHVRDDLLPLDEKKRLLSVHKDVHELRVKKQKELRDQRKQVKEGKISLQVYREGKLGAGMNSQYRANPILANKAQFSGIDAQVNPNPLENVADTNPGQRDELQNRYQLQYQPQNVPRFNPKPQFNG